MRGPARIPYRWPQNGFLGMDDREGITSPVFARGFLSALYDYHIIGMGRLLKRRGSQPWQGNGDAVNGANAIQRLWHYRFEGTSKLVAACNGGLFYDNGGSWSDISGTASFSSSANAIYRFTHFRDDSTSWLIGTDGSNNLFKCVPGTTAAAPMATTAPYPTKARDVTEFMGRLFVINTDAGPHQVEFSDDGSVTLWNALNNIPGGPRRSEGIGLSKHTDESLLVFFRDTVFRIVPLDRAAGDYASEIFFAFRPVDQTRGAIATGSIITSKMGYTYFASDEGIFRIRDPQRPAEYLSEGLKGLWAGLNKSRLPYIQAFERGEPWNEVVFLVSDGASTQHDLALVYNPVIASLFRSNSVGWSVFRSDTGDLKYNCGVNYKNADSKDITLLGGYDGVVDEAWGDANYPTGNRDNANGLVVSELKTGLLDLGYDGLKRIVDPWMEIQTTDEIEFLLRATGIGETPNLTMSREVGSVGDQLSISFVFDQSAFAASSPGQMKFLGRPKSRSFQFTLTESGDREPHEIHRFILPHKRQGLRLAAGR